MKKAALFIGLVLVVVAAAYIYIQYFNPATKVISNEIEYVPNAELTLDDLREMQQEINRKNYRKEFLQVGGAVKLKQVGIYNGKVVEEQYHCGDLCPDHGIFFLAYKDIELVYKSIETDQCTAIDGYKVYAKDWGSRYVGCSPIRNKYSY